MTREEAVALLERYSNYDGMGIPNLAGCKEAMKVAVDALKEAFPGLTESEDERIRKRLIEYFEGFRMGNAEVKWEGLNVQEVLVWLEKQKEQKPAEWSEEDEKMLKAIDLSLNCYSEGQAPALVMQISRERDWIKSFRPQYHGDITMTEAYKMGKEAGEASHWKPTELQMTILKAVKEYVGKGSGYWGEGLGSLIDDLEKLM